MAVFNAAKREIDIKIVYYGPALCGKTTNVQCVHKMLAPTQRGDIMSLATKDDRTLFFDFLPIELGDVKGFKTRFHVYTVPGQVYYALTRRAVLTGVDGVVFVADSQASKMEENIESLQDLNENLNYYKKDLNTIPFVMQYNKRDMDNILPIAELNQKLNTSNVPSFASSAVDGTGVIETLTACCKLVFKQMDSSGGEKKRRRQRKEAPVPPSPLPSSTPAESTQPAPPPPPSAPLSFDDDDGPVIKIIADDDLSAPVPPKPASSEPLIPDFASLDDSETKKPDDSAEMNAAEFAVTTEKQEMPSDLPSFETPSLEPEEAEETAPVFSSLDAQADDVISAEQPPVAAPVDLQQEETDLFGLEECGTPQKITAKAINVPLQIKNNRTGQLFTVTVTVSFDDFSIS